MGWLKLACVGEKGKGREDVVASMRGAGVRIGEVGRGRYSYRDSGTVG